MNNIKSVMAVLQPPSAHMVGDGFRVHNFFPSLQEIGLRGMSPFFLMDYNSKWDLTPSERQRGVGVHPHRGFETVTIAYHGKIAHHDSAGNSGVIGEGDVQWMTAGSGVLHKEYHEKEFSRKGGIFQMIQLWVNLPAKFKMTPAKYQAIENNKMGKFFSDDKKTLVEIIAGEYNGIKGPAFTFTPMHMFTAKYSAGAKAEFSFPGTYNTGLLVVEGEIRVNNTKIVAEDNFVMFNHDGSEFSTEALKDSIVLIISGEPINEPVASYGPFVMNTDAEIKKAYEDYFAGKFGFLME
jgi:redox-sensitive bicupin YhaK (pirin superfamily)